MASAKSAAKKKQGSSSSTSAMEVDQVNDALNSNDMEEESTPNKRKQRSESTSTVASANSATSATTNDSEGAPDASSNKNPVSNTPASMDDAGSSRLFQPHRSLGLLTAASSAYKSAKLHSSISGTPPSANLFQSQKGKFHLQPQATSSNDTFVSLPLGDRFQIVTVSKLVPVLVSRGLPPSAGHYRSSKDKSNKHSKHNGMEDVNHPSLTDQLGFGGGDEEEMHQVISDSSLSISVATHGPKSLGRAVSITLYQRTRPTALLDAFPFLDNEKMSKRSMKKKHCWGIVDVIHLGKQRVAMPGEKEGKLENALLLAIVCARADAGSGSGSGKGDEQNGGREVEVVGNDSDESDNDSDESIDESSEDSESNSNSDSSSDNESAEDKDLPPSNNCYGRVLIVQATRTSIEIIKTIDLDGVVGSNFIPHVGMHPATYVNKILLGGRPTDAAVAASESGGKGDVSPTSLLLLNIRSGKMIHSFQCLSNKKAGASKHGKKKQSPGESDAHYPIITTLEQSPAVDTIAVGTSDGSVHLINTLHDVKLFSLIHKSNHAKLAKTMNAVSSISFRTDGNATRQGVAPLAVGCDDGSISVWDLTPVEDNAHNGKPRRTLLTHMDGAHFGGISKVEYLPGEPLLFSTGIASNSILLHVFDAPDHSGRILRQRKGHTSPPELLRYLHPGVGGGGILANASDGTDASSCQILSCGGAGDLSLRVFSSARSNLDKEYSQGPGLERKAKKLGKLGPEGRAELLLPEIVGLATSEARSRDWGDLVTIHRNHAMAYIWSTKRGSQSGPVLKQPQWNISAMKQRPPRSANATSLAISACGNFALVGTLGGVIYKYNLQSGLPRGSFPRDATSQTAEEERVRRRNLKFAGDVGRTMRILEKKAMKGGITTSDMDQAERERISYMEVEARRKSIIDRATHDEAVVGIAIDSLNKTVVTAGADSKLVLWSFTTHMPHKKSPIMLPSPATKMCHVRDSDLAAIAMADFGVAVFDCSSLAIVRYFGGSRVNRSLSGNRMSHTGPISDMGFGPDGRKLFTSSFDGTIRVWDVPTGLCVDWMSFSSPPTSLALSPTGEFLATSHVGRLGISLWCDKSFFRMVLLDGTPTEPAKMNEPCPVAECEQESADLAASHVSTQIYKGNTTFDDPSNENEGTIDGPPPAKKEGLITLSGLPPGHWKNLFHLELVKERNKPTEAPQKPPQAPFFLQWRSGVESSTGDGADQGGTGDSAKEATAAKDDGWDAAWSDDDADDNANINDDEGSKAELKEESTKELITQNKRRKVVHHRSKLAELLQTCFDAKDISSSGEAFSEVTSYLSKMGPSSIDVEISSLCYGSHDLEDGLPLLQFASMWLLEACESNQSFEAVNAYLHRFLHVHGSVITRIDDALQKGKELSSDLPEDEQDDPQKLKLREFIDVIAQLREKQRTASNRLQEKMQHTICLLRHLSRMV